MKATYFAKRSVSVIFSVLMIVTFAACNFDQNPLLSSKLAAASDSEIPSAAQKPPPSTPRSFKTDALVFQGTATAFGDAESIIKILDQHGLTYEKVNSSQLDALTLDDLSQYGMIIWPGGYAGQMSSSLNASTRERIRQAVNDRGVSFVGFCAGAFIAISPAAQPNTAGPSWGFALVSAPTLPYYHLEDEGTESAMVQVKMANGKSRSLLWWGGPKLPDFPNGVVARYSDTNEAAIIQTWAGRGLMILAGPHPEAPESWYDQLGLKDPDGLDHDIAWSMFQAALKQELLPTLN